jgi:TP901 family phage tail tape measure protein
MTTETVEIKIKVVGIGSAQRDLKKVKGEVKGFGNDLQKSLGVKGVAIGTALGNAISSGLSKSVRFVKDSFSKALEFGDELASVRKSVGFTADEVKDFGDEVLKLSRHTRTASDELLDIAQIGGQLGIGSDEILKFTDNVDKLAVALGDEFLGGAEQVTQEIGVLAQILKDVSGEQVSDRLLKIGNAVNVLGAEGLATGPVMADMTRRMASAGVTAGVGSADMLAFAATLEATGVNAQLAGGSMSRLFQLIPAKSKDIAKAFRDMGVAFDKNTFFEDVNKNLPKAIIEVAHALTQAGLSNEQLAQFLDETGLKGTGVSTVLQNLGQNVGLFDSNLRLAVDALGETDSIMEEYNIKNETAAAKMEKLRNRVDNVTKLLDLREEQAPLIEAQEALPGLEFQQELLERALETARAIGDTDVTANLEESLDRINKKIEGNLVRQQIMFTGLDETFAGLGINVDEAAQKLIALGFTGEDVGNISFRIQAAADETNDLKTVLDASQKALEDLNQAKLDEVQDHMQRAEQDMKDLGLATLDEQRKIDQLNQKSLGGVIGQMDSLNRRLGDARWALSDALQKIAGFRLPGFEKGGIVGYQDGGVVGGRSFSGDKIMAGVNSGEMILNRSQQGALFSFIEKLSRGGFGDTNSNNVNNLSVNFSGSGRGQMAEQNIFTDLLAKL